MGKPTALINPQDVAELGITEGAEIILGNQRGQITLNAKSFEGVNPGVVIVEGIHPNHAFIDGKGINTLTSADISAPNGGAPYHDTHIWIRPK